MIWYLIFSFKKKYAKKDTKNTFVKLKVLACASGIIVNAE